MVKDYVVFDLETTGLSPDKDTIIEIGALKVIQGKVADRFSEFINPYQKLTQQISELTGITDDMLAGARNLQAVVGDFVDFCEDYVVVGHNLGFDYRFTKMAAEKYHLPFEHEGIDTLKIAKTVHKICRREVWAHCVNITVLSTVPHIVLTMMHWRRLNCIRRWPIILKHRSRSFLYRRRWALRQKSSSP